MDRILSSCIYELSYQEPRIEYGTGIMFTNQYLRKLVDILCHPHARALILGGPASWITHQYGDNLVQHFMNGPSTKSPTTGKATWIPKTPIQFSSTVIRCQNENWTLFMEGSNWKTGRRFTRYFPPLNCSAITGVANGLLNANTLLLWSEVNSTDPKQSLKYVTSSCQFHQCIYGSFHGKTYPTTVNE